MFNLYPQRLSRAGCVLFALSLAGPALGQQAYFSLQGDFPTAGDELDLYFDLFSVNDSEVLRFETHSYLGGTNAAGDVIAANAFDSNLELFDGVGGSRGQNDYIAAGDLDALLTWAPIQTTGTPLNPSPLPADNYRLNLRPYSASVTSPWSLDLVGPANDLTFTGATPTGTSTLDSLKFGTTGVAFNAATFNHSSGSLNLTGNLTVANTGLGAFNLTSGTVTNGFGYIGLNPGTVGQAMVTGMGTTWTNNDQLYVGASGNGTLNVQAGGAVSNTYGWIGTNPSSTSTATINGTDSTWTNFNGLVVGYDGTGTLNVQAGGAVTNSYSFLATNPGSNGTATVTGAGSSWTSSAGLYLGGSDTLAGGTGTLDVLDSGLVDVTGPMKIWNTGTVTLDGGSINANGGLDNSLGGTLNHYDGTLTVTGGAFAPNAGGPSDNYVIDGMDLSDQPLLVIGSGGSAAIGRDLIIGSSDTGTLTVEDGGTVSNSAFAFIGRYPNSTGTATVTGANAMWNNSGYLELGRWGTGTLNVEAGGAVSNTGGYIGSFSQGAGTATVTGLGSMWTNLGDLHLGGGGTGTLNVQDGGAVSNTEGFIGSFSGSTGTATVTGTNSMWTNLGKLDVGASGTGTLNVEAGGVVSNTDGFIGFDDVSVGTATVTGLGSMWDNSSDLSVGETGTGTLNVEAGGVVSNTNGFIGNGAGSTGTATVTGLGSVWTNLGDLDVGAIGSGTLNVEAGGVVSNTDGFIGFDDVSVGTATVTGLGSMWDNSSDLSVGETGTGTLNVEAGGVVSNTNGFIGNGAGSTGTATVTGLGSNWTNSSSLTVGDSGNGTLNVEDGGAVSNTFGYIGRYSVSTGTATVTGTGSTWTNTGLLTVGDSGTGTLNVEAGGAVTIEAGGVIGDKTSKIGFQSDSTGTVTVTGLGSTLTNLFGLTVGAYGTGTLNVEDGGGVSSSSDSYIGIYAGSTGTATVTGPGSMWTHSGNLDVGGYSILPGGTGSMQILDGGEVAASGALKIWNTGSVLLDGGILSVGSIDTASLANLDFQAGTFNLTADNLVVGAAGLFSGELFVNSQKTINVTNLATIEADGTLVVSGGFNSGGLTNLGTAIFIDTTIGGPVINPTGSNLDVVGNVTFTGLFSGGGGIFGSGTADFQGGFSPGDSPALVTVEGSANFGASNTLFIEIGGLLAGTEFDVVDIAGSLTADGTLDVSLINAFAPSAGDNFDILDWGSLTGNFSVINLPTLGGGLNWDTSNLLIDGTLSVISTVLIGDLDSDGFVGITDLNAILSNWNATVTAGDLLAGDPSGDGFVGIEDLNVVLGNWNAGTPPGESQTTIPEPATLSLFAVTYLGGMVLLRRRHV